ncbi:hypothetical protein BV22DRAFT_155252 [Leucogyrophana mollusca]|uniref:Uncharacterized protein n=1 Tax=Leucogyrophana mollusca TaxID=85980 RepID=A0ACB8BT33_9AGAM|nr:hypothetical protein BV22DRAFT_155252 [Leucogyrophana mollusca]
MTADIVTGKGTTETVKEVENITEAAENEIEIATVAEGTTDVVLLVITVTVADGNLTNTPDVPVMMIAVVTIDAKMMAASDMGVAARTAAARPPAAVGAEKEKMVWALPSAGLLLLRERFLCHSGGEKPLVGTSMLPATSNTPPYRLNRQVFSTSPVPIARRFRPSWA